MDLLLRDFVLAILLTGVSLAMVPSRTKYNLRC